MNIFLCDLVHVSPGSYVVPLNIGYIASYTKSIKADVDIKLFKNLNVLLDALKSKTPDVIAFSNYSWNHNLCCSIVEFVKRNSPGTPVLMGGLGIRDDDQTYIKIS